MSDSSKIAVAEQIAGRRRSACTTSRRRIWLLSAAVGVVACGLRLQGTALRNLWFDEAFSWRMAGFSPAEIVARSAADNNPPLYYLVLKLWMAIAGESALALRLLSVAASVATCLGAYVLVRDAYVGEKSTARVADARNATEGVPYNGGAWWMPLLAAALIAVSTYQIRWAWEARMYTLCAALAVWSSWLLVRALISNEICHGQGDTLVRRIDRIDDRSGATAAWHAAAAHAPP